MNTLRAEEAASRTSLDELRRDCRHHSPRAECAIPRNSTDSVCIRRRRRLSNPIVLAWTDFWMRGRRATSVLGSSRLLLTIRTPSTSGESRSQLGQASCEFGLELFKSFGWLSVQAVSPKSSRTVPWSASDNFRNCELLVWSAKALLRCESRTYGAISLRPSVSDVSRPVSILLIRAHKLCASDADSERS